jgi:Ser/Thr protein kinase RdoA (MazF antagonist)
MMLNAEVQTLLLNLEQRFGLKFVSVERAIREDNDPVLNLFLEDQAGQKFFLKEIQPHSLREGMDEIYAQLSRVRSKSFRILVPKEYADNQFLFRLEEKTFVLMDRVSLCPFDPVKMSYGQLLSAVDEFHNAIAGFNFPSQSYRTFQSWIERGLDKVTEKYGPNIPLVPRFREFMRDRYPLLRLAQVNIHWDVHKNNLCFDEKVHLVILDLDLIQRGEIACDISRVSYLYADQRGSDFTLSSAVVSSATEHLRKTSPEVEERDVCFLITRTPLGPMQLPDYALNAKDSLRLLENLENFVLGK